MKLRKLSTLLAMVSITGLAAAPLAFGADPDRDNRQNSNQDVPMAKAEEKAKPPISKIDSELQPSDNRGRVMAKAQETESHDIMSLANSNRDLQKFVTAIQAAGLTQTLQGEGPYTVFAPSDNAFAALGKNSWDDLLKLENQQKLANILSFHVVPGKMLSKDIQAGDYVSLEGNPLTAVVSDKDMMVNEAKVVQKDIVASNGVIHIIDRVMMPPPTVPERKDTMSSIND